MVSPLFVVDTVNGEKIEFTLTGDEEVELLRKVTVMLLTKLPPEEAHKHLNKFLKFV
jgi:hypothetical protein